MVPPLSAACLSSGTTTVTSSVAASLKSWRQDWLCSSRPQYREDYSNVSHLSDRKMNFTLTLLFYSAPFGFHTAFSEWWRRRRVSTCSLSFFFRSSCRWFSRSFARVRTRFQNNVPCLFYAACKNQMDGVQPRQQMPGSLDRPLEGVSKQCSALADWKHRNHISIILKYFTFCILVVYLKYVICNLTLHTQAERHTYMLSYIILQMTWSDRSTGI